MNDEQKMELAIEALESFDFGCDVVDDDGWKKDGDTWSIKVYLDDIDHEDTIPASFTITWEDDKIIDQDYCII
jgi:hypothetical protein